MMSDNEEEKNEKVIKDNEIKTNEEKVENEIIPDKHTVFDIIINFRDITYLDQSHRHQKK